MKNLYLNLMGVIVAILAFSACTHEAEVLTPNENPQEESSLCTFTIPEVPVHGMEGSSRTAISIEENQLKFVWAVGDRIGILPDDGAQVYFSIDEETAGGTHATFDGGAWALKANHQYDAYFPFIEDIMLDRTAVPVDYTDQQQTGNNSMAHLGSHDYLAAKGTTNANGGVNYTFQRMGSVAILKFTVPDAGKKLENVTLTADEAVFTTKGTIDLDAETLAIEATETSESLTIALEDIETNEANEEVTIYFMCYPDQLEGKKLNVTVDYEGADEPLSLVTDGKNMEAGDGYILLAEVPTVEVLTVTDLSPLVEGETDKYKTANCYIVTGAGNYKFRATHMGNSNAEEHALTIDHVAVLWETFGTSNTPSVGDLVKDATYTEGYISFIASDKEGNALIAAYNSSNEIVWSWHIWMTDQPQEHQYVNSSGLVVGTMMDRNLGATSATPSDGVATYGLFYQWGRKDPFMGACVMTGYEQNGKAASTGTWTFNANTDQTGTIEFSIKNPTSFLGKSLSTDGWCWENQGELWAETKTIYDPSPYGWKIPAYGNNFIWSKAYMRNQEVDETNKGRLITNNGNSIWYPFAGHLGGNQYGAGIGGLNVVAGSGNYHVTLDSNKYYAYLCSNENEAMTKSGSTCNKAAGNSVRCMKE